LQILYDGHNQKRLITEEPDAVFLGLPPLAACGADLPMVRLDEQDVANISRLQMTPDAEWVAIAAYVAPKYAETSAQSPAPDCGVTQGEPSALERHDGANDQFVVGLSGHARLLGLRKCPALYS